MIESSLQTLKAAGIVSEDNDIKIDLVYDKLSKIAKETGSITCKVPLLDKVTFSSQDVDCMYAIMTRKCTERKMSTSDSDLSSGFLSSLLK